MLEIFGNLHSQAACDVITSLAAITHTSESKNSVIASQPSAALSWLRDLIVSIVQFAASLFLESSGSAAVLELLQQPKTNLTRSTQTDSLWSKTAQIYYKGKKFRATYTLFSLFLWTPVWKQSLRVIHFITIFHYSLDLLALVVKVIVGSLKAWQS